MPKYRALKTIQVQTKHPGGSTSLAIYNPGDELEYEGNPGDSLEALDKAGEDAKKAWVERRGQLRAKSDMDSNSQTRAMVAAMFELFGGMSGGKKLPKLGGDDDDEVKSTRHVPKPSDLQPQRGGTR